MENTLPHNEDEISTASFELWLKKSRPGDKFIYHVGRLAIDREDIQLVPGMGYAHVFYEPYHGTGTMAWYAYRQGQVELVQRKLPGNRGYEYIAFKRKGARR